MIIVRPASGPEPVAEPQEVALVDGVEHPGDRLLDNLVLQGGYAERTHPPVTLGYPSPLRGLRPVAPAVNAGVEVRDAVLQVLAVARPRLAVHAGGRVMLQGMVRIPQQARRHVVQKIREPQRRVLPCCRTHPVQPTRRMIPAQCPVHGRLSRVSLGHRPFLPCLRRRAGPAAPTGGGGGLPSLPFRLQGGFPVPPCPPTSPCPLPAMGAQALFGTFAGTTPMSDSPAASTSGLRPRAFPDRPQGQRPTGSHWGLPVLAHRASAHAQGFRLRGAGPPLADTATARVAFPTLQRGRHPGGVISELNGWPAFPPVNASPAALPSPTHDSGPW